MRKLDLIMLVDDDLITNFLNELIIKEMDITEKLVIASDGQQALDEIASFYKNGKSPDLILLDVNMPGLSGFDFLKKFYELDYKFARIPKIIMLTTSLNPVDKEKAEKFKIDGYLSKPLTKEELNKIMTKFFSPGTFNQPDV